MALVIFELGSAVCGLSSVVLFLTAATSSSNNILIFGRAIQGIGATGLQTGMYTAVGLLVSPRSRPMYATILGAIACIGSIIGPAIGGVLTDKLSWRWCFYINLPLGACVGVLLLFGISGTILPAPVRRNLIEILRQLDILGVALLLGATLCLLLTLQSAGIQTAWNQASIIGGLVGFGVLLFGFGLDQYLMKENAAYPLRIIKDIAWPILWSFTSINLISF